MISDQIRPLLDSRQFDCLLLTHIDVRRLAEVQVELLTWAALELVPVGRELSQALLHQPRAERGRQSERWLHDRLASSQSTPLLADIDLLFEPDFNLDPLTLLRQAARRQALIALWPGSFQDATLTYALPEHHHYRSWSSPQTLILPVP